MSLLIDEGVIDNLLEKDNKDEDDKIQVKRRTYMTKKKLLNFKESCFFCGQVFVLNKGGKVTRNVPKCNKCRDGKVTKRSVLMEKKCSACKKVFEVTNHMRKIEKNGKTIWRVRCTNCKRFQRAPRGPLPTPKNNYFECDICGKVSKARHLIYQHMDNHRTGDDLECKVCHKKSKNRGVLRTHLKSHFESFICHLCGFIGKTAYTLRHHMSAHEADPTQVKNFTNFEPISRFHKKPMEKGEFICRYCGYGFHTKSALQAHEMRRHETTAIINDFKCKVCGEVFQHSNDLRVHNYTHSTRPLLFCEYEGCSQFFNRIKPLNAHIRNVHKAKNIVCEICNKKFKMRGSLVKHQKNNRCVPITVRKVNSGRASIPGPYKAARIRSVDQLAEDALIAKEQFRSMGGVLKDDVNRYKRKKKVVEKKAEEYSSESEWNNSSGDDETEISRSEEIKVKVESDNDIPVNAIDVKNDHEDQEIPIPMMKIEIKMEPMDDEPIEYVQDLFNFDNFTDNQDDSMNPSVVLERLDFDTLNSKYQPKTKVANKQNKSKPTSLGVKRQPRIFFDKYMDKYKRKLVDLTCDNCGDGFSKKIHLKEHILSHTYDDSVKKFHCTRCKDKFFLTGSLQLHMKEFHQKKIGSKIAYKQQNEPFICDICGNSYNSYASISGHLKIVHKKVADFCCHICPSKFKTRMYLERHVEDVHEKIMRFQCNFCGKFFKRKHQVKEHERLHNDPVPCHMCGKMVRNLHTHIKQVHKYKKKPDQTCCAICGQMVKSYNMQHHIDRIHNKLPIPGKLYPCLQCSEIFNRSDDLRRHKYTAHLDKPLKVCPYEGCSGLFPRTKALNVHIKNVHRNSQLTCKHCNKSFNSESGIRKHLANKHMEHHYSIVNQEA